MNRNNLFDQPSNTPASDDPAALYDAAFFHLWGRDNGEYVRSARAIAEEIYRVYEPRRVMDVGCGSGQHAGRLVELGAEVIPVDGFPCPVEERAPNLPEILPLDLTQEPQGESPRVDLVLCLDVAEHLPAEAAPVLVRHLTRAADLVVFSAAPPNQGGTGHVNEQPRSYWIEQFNRAGFRYCRKEAGLLDRLTLARREEITLRWMATQLAVFRRGTKYPFPPMALPAKGI